MTHNILAGKRGIIFGAVDENSLAWHVATHCYAEGARFVLTNTPVALQLGHVEDLAAMTESEILPCDATDTAQLDLLLRRAQEILGGKIDFILHAVAMSMNIRRHKTYENLNYNYFQQTLDISALSLHKLLQVAMQQDAIAEGGSVVALTYVASQRPMAGYCDMGDAKALLESIARSFGRVYGEKRHVRINTLSQSPTPTRASQQCHEIQCAYKFADQISPLGNADADSCADMCVMLFSDYTRFVTMQNIFNDGGFATTGLSMAFTEYVRKLYE